MNRVEPGCKSTQKTIEQLKKSIDSIEKMIEKSQQILVNARTLEPREGRPDSLELRLRSRSKKKALQRQNKDRISNKLNLTNSSAEDIASPQTIVKIRRKTQKKPKLFIDTEAINQSGEEDSSNNILIHDYSMFPVSTIDNPNQHSQPEQSLMDSFENPFKLQKRFKTEAIDDSWEQYSLEGSLDKKKEKRSPVRKIILHRKRPGHLKNYSQLQKNENKQRKKIYDCRIQPGKYSYLQKDLAKKQTIKKLNKQNKQRIQDLKVGSARAPCLKNVNESEQMTLQNFQNKVKKYGFVERYLTKSKISCIYEYLKNSDVPSYKWPLYVVNEVYGKMQTPKNRC